jgi:hypothetical protein
MHLPFLASITHQITTRLSKNRKIIAAKDMLNDRWRGMAQATMPSNLIGHLGRTHELFACGELERIKTSLNLAMVKDFLRFVILNQKMPWVKFIEYMIIIGETMDTNKIFVSSRDMEYGLQY